MPAENSTYVEFHAWETGSPSYPAPGWRDVSDFVVSVDWASSVNAPWGGAAILLSVPFPLVSVVLPGRQVPFQQATPSGPVDASKATTTINAPRVGQVPETGFWVVIGQKGADGKKHTLGLYRCSAIQFSQAPGYGAVPDTQPITITCENFLSFLASSRLQLAPAQGTWGQPGFVYDLNSWGLNLNALLNGVLRSPLGPLFAQLWEYMVRVTLPPSLGYGTLGNQVKIVYDNATAANYAQMRTGSFQQVIGWMITSPTMPDRSQSLLDFFLGLFRADPRLVEIFPSLEYTLDSFVAKAGKTPDGEPLPAVDTRTPVGKALNAQPVVVYRYRPWIVKPITTENVNASLAEDGIKDAAGNQKQVNGQTACQSLGYMQNATATAPGVADIAWFDIAANEIEHLLFAWHEADRVNLTVPSNFAADSGPMSYGYNPPLVKDAEQVSRHGLRVSEYHWPYFPPQNATPDNLQAAMARLGNALKPPPPDPATLRTPIEGAPDFTLEYFRDRQDREDVPAPYVDNAQRLARNLQVVKNRLGDITLVCGYRTPEHNQRNYAKDPVGVAQSSLHTQALAADFRVSGLSVPALYLKMLELIADGPENGGIEAGQLGIYDNDKWVHYAPTGTGVYFDKRVKQKNAVISGKTFAAWTKELRTRNGVSAPKVGFLNKASSFPNPLDYAKALNEIGWAMTGESQRFCRGSAVVQYRPWLQAGHWVRLYQDGYCLSAYVDTVSHRVVRDQGSGAVLMASTTLNYLRGTLRYYDAGFREQEYQAPMMTLEANAGGSPATMSLGQAAQKIAGGVGKALSALGTAINSTLPSAIQVGGRKSFRFVNAPGILPGGQLATKKRDFIIIHQSDTLTVKELVDLFKKPLKRLNAQNKPEVYYRSTNYTVDKDGSVIQWVDPALYYTAVSCAWSGIVSVEQTINIDFIGKLGETLTDYQVRAGAALLQRLTASYSIPLVVAPDRTNGTLPVMSRSEDGVVYGVFRHRSFADPWCPCCNINPQTMVTYAKQNTDISLVPEPDVAGYLKSLGVA